MFKTKMTEMLAIQHPIMQGGMQHLGTPELAAAVSNAGGLGTINVTIYPTPEELRAAIRRTKELTGKPFCVNVSIIPSLSLGDMTYKQLDVCFEEGITCIETAGAGPQAFSEILTKAELVWIHKAASVKHAKKAEQLGADMVTIAGFEVAGHPGKDMVGSIVLTNMVARAVKIPILAAGGFADGNGLAAALSLGAEGVVMGTRFVATKECVIHQNFKDYVVNASEYSSALCQQTINNMVRVADNEAARKCQELEAKGATLEELMTVIAGKISKTSYQEGLVEKAMFAMGPAAGLVDQVQSAKEVIDDIMSEAEQAVARLDKIAGR